MNIDLEKCFEEIEKFNDPLNPERDIYEAGIEFIDKTVMDFAKNTLKLVYCAEGTGMKPISSISPTSDGDIIVNIGTKSQSDLVEVDDNRLPKAGDKVLFGDDVFMIYHKSNNWKSETFSLLDLPNPPQELYEKCAKIINDLRSK